MKNSSQHGRGRGANIYLTQQEMDLILEALNMLHLDYCKSAIVDQIEPIQKSIEGKICKKLTP